MERARIRGSVSFWWSCKPYRVRGCAFLIHPAQSPGHQIAWFAPTSSYFPTRGSGEHSVDDHLMTLAMEKAGAFAPASVAGRFH